MCEITKKERLTSAVTKMTVYSPLVAKGAKAGQFIILRVDENGERIPLTVFDVDVETGFVTIVYQVVGKTTMLLDKLNVGDKILNFVGPLGRPTALERNKKVLIIAGGVGSAVVYMQSKRLRELQCEVDIVAGFRSKEDVILEKDLSSVSDRLTIVTNDGSYGEKGLVTDVLRKDIENGNAYDLVISVGPIPMMKAVCEITKKIGLKTIVSMNPIMIDGTGMCGGCRLSVGGETKFACVDGPDFDGHEIDFDEAIMRLSTYKNQEQDAVRRHQDCRLMNANRQIK